MEFQINHLLKRRSSFQVSEFDDDFARRSGLRTSHRDPTAELYFKLQISSGYRHEFLQLSAEHLGDEAGLRNIVIVAACLLCHAGQQLFVVVGAEAEKGARDASCFDIGGVTYERVKILDSSGRIAIGQDDQSSRSAGIGDGQDLLHAEQEPIVEVGCIPGHQALNSFFDPWLVGHPLRGHEDIDRLFKGHDAQNVIRPHQVDDVGASLFNIVERRTFHRTGTINDQAQVERCSRANASHRRTAGDEIYEKLFSSGAVRHGCFATGHNLGNESFSSGHGSHGARL